MYKRLPLLFRRVTYNLRGGFLVRPLTIALTLGCAGALLSWLEESVAGVNAWVPRVLFPSHADPQVAQVILGGIAASIMTVVSIVFAILLSTLSNSSPWRVVGYFDFTRQSPALPPRRVQPNRWLSHAPRLTKIR